VTLGKVFRWVFVRKRFQGHVAKGHFFSLEGGIDVCVSRLPRCGSARGWRVPLGREESCRREDVLRRAEASFGRCVEVADDRTTAGEGHMTVAELR
jgi:hypothetical protein